MEIPIDLPPYIFGDNQSVLTNSSVSNSNLKMKLSSTTFHFVSEGVAHGEWLNLYQNMNENPPGMCTKSLPGGEKKNKVTSYILQYL